MKLSRDGLKALVKECLVELLREGLGDLLGEQKKSTNQQQAPTVAEMARKSQQAIKYGKSAETTPTIKEAIKRESGGDPVMAELLADTAKNTLPKMLQSDISGHISSIQPGVPGVGQAELVVANSNPEDIFGEEAASKWASIAFMGK